MFKLAIIVPADGPQEDLDNTLLTVLENRPPACQVIVPHPTTYEDPYDLSDEVTFIPVPGDDLATLINSAVQACDAEIVHVLLSGTLARDGWTETALEQFRTQPHIAAVAPAILDPDNDRRLTSAGIRYGRGGVKKCVAQGRKLRRVESAPPAIDGPMLQAAFIRREVFRGLGGLRNAFGPHHIDTDFAARLKAAEKACVHLPDCQVVGPPPGAVYGFQAARHAELLYWCHARQLHRRGAMACHALHVVGDVLRQIPRPSVLTALLGRTCGLSQGLLRCEASEIGEPIEDEESISIPIEEGRRSARQRAQPNEQSVRRYSRSA